MVASYRAEDTADETVIDFMNAWLRLPVPLRDAALNGQDDGKDTIYEESHSCLKIRKPPLEHDVPYTSDDEDDMKHFMLVAYTLSRTTTGLKTVHQNLQYAYDHLRDSLILEILTDMRISATREIRAAYTTAQRGHVYGEYDSYPQLNAHVGQAMNKVYARYTNDDKWMALSSTVKEMIDHPLRIAAHNLAEVFRDSMLTLTRETPQLKLNDILFVRADTGYVKCYKVEDVYTNQQDNTSRVGVVDGHGRPTAFSSTSNDPMVKNIVGVICTDAVNPCGDQFAEIIKIPLTPASYPVFVVSVRGKQDTGDGQQVGVFLHPDWANDGLTMVEESLKKGGNYWPLEKMEHSINRHLHKDGIVGTESSESPSSQRRAVSRRYTVCR